MSVGIFVVLCAPQAHAQRRRINEQPLTSEIISAPRELSSLIEEGKKSIARSQWAEASLALGTVLGLEGQPGEVDLDQDYFLEDASNTHYTRSLRHEARRLFDELPDAGQKFVELRYGVAAQKEFDEAAKRGDWEAISDTVRKYGFTEAGRNAAWSLGERAISEGDLYSAAMQFERMVNQPRARAQFGNALAVMAAACWKGAGQKDLARLALKQSLQHWPKSQVVWQEQKWTLKDNDADLNAMVEKLDLGRLAVDPPRKRQWLTPGGRADNNAHGYAAPVLPIFRWDQEMHPSIQDQAAVRKKMRDRATDRSANLQSIPSRMPLVIDPWVIVRTYDQRTIGIDQRTGKKVWDSTFEGPPVLFAPDPMFDRLDTFSDGSERLFNAVWAEAPLGQLASDGKRLFGVCDVSAVEAVENAVLGANLVRANPRPTSNVLRAWSLTGQGSLVWEIGSENGLQEPLLAGALFLGPPTPWEGQLLTLTEINGEVFLLCLEGTTGKLVWRQQLVASANMPIAADSSRRQLAAVPSVFGNMVVCPTLSGFLVAYDLSTRSLMWAHHYEQTGNGMTRANVFGSMQFEAFDAMQSRMVEYAPLIANGVVVHMPSEVDAVNFYALDLLTGAPLWTTPRERWRYLGGVYEDRLLVIGDTMAAGFKLREGQRAWKDIEFTGARVVGHGARNQHEYYVPLSTQEMARLDLREGKISQRYRVENTLGNLVATDRALVSVSPLDVRFYALRERPNADSEIDSLRDPESATALAHQAELALGDGNLEDALRWIKKAYEKDSKNNDITRILSIIGIQAIKSDFNKFGPEVRQFDRLLSEGVDGTLFLTVMIDGFVKQQQYVEAFDKLMLLAADPLYSNYPGIEGNVFEPERGLIVQLDRWIRSQFHRIWEAASASEREAISKRVQTILAQASDEVLHLKRRRIKHLLDLPLVADIAFSIAEELRRVEDFSAADQLYCHVAELASPEIREKVLRSQAEMYFDLDRITTAFQTNRKLKNPIQLAKDRPDNLGMIGSPMPPRDLEELDKQNRQWKEGHPYVDAQRAVFGSQLDGTSFEVIIEEGDQLDGWSVEQRIDSIRISNPWGYEVVDIPVPLGTRAANDLAPIARCVNNWVYLEMPNEVIAIDTLAQGMLAIRWREDFDVSTVGDYLGGMGGFSSSESLERSVWNELRKRTVRESRLVTATANGVILKRGDELVCLDALNKDRIWTRRGFSKNPVFFRSGEQLLCWEQAIGQLTILDIRTGAMVDRRDLPGGFEWKHSVGDLILMDKKVGDRRGEMQLWNWREAKVILHRATELNTVATISEGGKRWVAWEPSGNMYFWNLETGQEFQHRLRAENRLVDIKVAEFGESFLILPTSHQYRQEISLQQPERFRKVSGPIMAINAADGRPLWDRAPVVYEYYFPWSQHRTSPVVTLLRRVNWKVTEPRIENRELLSIHLLDIRSGRTLFHSDTLPSVHGVGFSQNVNPSLETTSVEYGGQRLLVRFTSDEEPPYPIGDVGNISAEDFRFLMSDPEFYRELDRAFDDDLRGTNEGVPMIVPKRNP